MLTPKDYFTSSGKYPNRETSAELTDEVRKNAVDLNNRINALLAELGITAKYSSGFRTSLANAKTPGAAVNSKHMTGNAADLEDFTKSLGRLLLKRVDLLEKYGLWMEDPAHTKGWVHLQRIAPRSGKRVFKP